MAYDEPAVLVMPPVNAGISRKPVGETRMPVVGVETNVRRVTDTIAVVDFNGQLTSAAENCLVDAYGQASSASARSIILNLTGLEYMNSSGIVLLVNLLTQMKRRRQRLFMYGVRERYQQIFALTRLDEVIGIFATEGAAVAAAAAAWEPN
jgi:anti-sigma B factor antagonist